MEILPLLAAPAAAGLADVLLTKACRFLFTSTKWAKRGEEMAIRNHAYQNDDREAYGWAIQKMESARFALARTIGIGIGAAGCAGSLLLNQPEAAYGFASLAAAEVIAGAADLHAAGFDGVREFAFGLVSRVLSFETVEETA